MKTHEMAKVAQLAQTVEGIEVFEAVDIQSITVQANLFLRPQGNDNRAFTVAIPVDESDPRFATLKTMLAYEAAAKKAAAQTELTAMGMTVEVPAEVITAAQQASGKAKAEHLELLERNRQKRLLAEALAADAAKTAN